VKRAALLAIAAAVYVQAAWMVAPGFYDGFTPQQPYNWVSPPPQAAPPHNPPQPGHLVIKVIGGVSDANSAFTNDGQLVIGFLPGAFDVSGGETSITVDITPEATFPTSTGLYFSTNVYLLTASAPLVKNANLVLRYSDIVPAPSSVYAAPAAGGAWKSIGGQDGQPFTIQTTTGNFGYFAAGYPSNITPPPGSITVGGGQFLPIAVAILIVLVVIAGIPLAIIRRRRTADGGDDEEEDA
jgi:hypothetical protein